jgi:hypothetical protein
VALHTQIDIVFSKHHWRDVTQIAGATATVGDGVGGRVSLLLAEFPFGVFVKGFAVPHHHAVLALELH